MTRSLIKYVYKLLKIIGFSIVGLSLLFFILTAVINIPLFQKKLANWVVSKIEKKIDTDISIAKISIDFPNSISVKDIFAADVHSDTLIYAGLIEIDINPLKLFHKEIHINRVVIARSTIHLLQNPDSTFNFQHYINAFGTESKEAKNDTSDSKISFSISNINLESVFFTYYDAGNENRYKTSLDKLRINIKNFDLQKKLIDISSIRLANTTIWVNTHSKQNKNPEPIGFDFRIQRKLELEHVNIYLADHFFKQEISLENVNLSVTPKSLNLPEYEVGLKKIKLSDTDIKFHIKERDQADSVRLAEFNDLSSAQAFLWNITVANLDLGQNSFSFLDDNISPGNSGIDFTDLQLSSIGGSLDDINLSRNRLSGNIKEFRLKEKSGFQLDELSVDFKFSDTNTVFDKLIIRTPNSNLKNTVSLNYLSVERLQKFPEQTIFDINIGGSEIGIADVRYFQSSLSGKAPLFDMPKKKLYLKGRLNGQLSDINVESLTSQIDSTKLLAHGKITGLPEILKTHFNVAIDTFVTTRTDVLKFAGDSIIPNSIHLPALSFLTGNYKGRYNNFNSSTNITSSFGAISFISRISPSENLKKRQVFSDITMKNFDVGKLLANDTIGKITLNAETKGTIALDSMSSPNLQIDLLVDSMDLFGYNYKHLTATGKYTGKSFSGKSSIADTNLVFDFFGKIDLSDTIPEFDFTLTMHGADLQALHLTPDNLSGRGILNLHMKGNTIDNLNGNMNISDAIILKNSKQYELDRITGRLRNTTDSAFFSLQSKPLKAKYSGTVKIGEIGNILKQYINQYFIIDKDSVHHKLSSEQFIFNIEIFNSEFITQVIVPDMESFLPGTIHGEFLASENKLDLHGNFPQIKYNDILIDSLELDLHSANSDKLNFSLKHRSLSVQPLNIDNTKVYGTIGDNKINAVLKIIDSERKEKFVAYTDLFSDGSEFRIHFHPDSLIINYDVFSIPVSNEIKISNKTVQFDSINLQSGSQQFIVRKDQENINLTNAYKLTLSHFALSNITGIFEAKSDLFDGILNGDIDIGKVENRSVFSTDLTVKNVLFYNDTTFNIVRLNANNMKSGMIHIDTRFKGENNELSFSGDIIQDSEKINLLLDIDHLSLQNLSPFLSQQFDELKGSISGKIDIQGSTEKPLINGKVNLADITALPSYLKTRIHIDKDEIKVKGRELIFENFSFIDEQNNSATIDGNISFNNLNEPSLKLKFKSDNFLFLNTTYKDNDLYYGKLLADMNADISGTIYSPDINLGIRIGGNSNFYLLIPGLNTASIEKEGVVRFIDRNDTIWSQIMKRNLISSDSATLVNEISTDIDLSANVEIDPGMQITIVVDPASNEELNVKGNANLSLSIKGKSSPELTGKYEISEGTYTLMLYDVIKRTFNIKKGSFLQWNGDMMNPRTDITASYEVNTSPLSLVANETSELSDKNNLQYSIIMPFLVDLNIKGELTMPAIDFNLNVPPGKGDALLQAKISQLNQDESELNKQVFSLLLFNSFIQSSAVADNPFAYEFNSTARSSVSRILTQQLNNFTNRHIKGFDVDVGVNSYYQAAGDQSTGRTDVTLDVSKNLFNDRLTVQVGGNLNVEGPGNTGNKDLNSMAGDVVLEYKLGREGTYRLRGFNVNEYEDIIDGEVTKTGAAFIFNKDFYSINKLFKSDSTKVKKGNNKNANE